MLAMLTGNMLPGCFVRKPPWPVRYEPGAAGAFSAPGAAEARRAFGARRAAPSPRPCGPSWLRRLTHQRLLRRLLPPNPQDKQAQRARRAEGSPVSSRPGGCGARALKEEHQFPFYGAVAWQCNTNRSGLYISPRQNSFPGRHHREQVVIHATDAPRRQPRRRGAESSSGRAPPPPPPNDASSASAARGCGVPRHSGSPGLPPRKWGRRFPRNAAIPSAWSAPKQE